MEANFQRSLSDLRHFSPNLGFPASSPFSTVKPFHSPNQSSLTRWRSQKVGFRSLASRLLVSNSVTNQENQAVEGGRTESVASASPLYVPTPPNRELRTPHSGYHFDGTTRQFFEGWYFKVSIPERKESFCFMYSVENPAFRKKLSPLEVAQHGPRSTGVGAQILGAYDKYICQYSEESQNFWGSRHELMLGNTFVAEKGMQPPSKEVPPQIYKAREFWYMELGTSAHHADNVLFYYSMYPAMCEL